MEVKLRFQPNFRSNPGKRFGFLDARIVRFDEVGLEILAELNAQEFCAHSFFWPPLDEQCVYPSREDAGVEIQIQDMGKQLKSLYQDLLQKVDPKSPTYWFLTVLQCGFVSYCLWNYTHQN